MTLFRLAVASHRGGWLATTLLGVVFSALTAAGFVQLAGNDPAQRALFAQQMTLLGRQLSYLLPIPTELDTMAGFLQWRMFGTLGLIYGFWALIAASGAGRGDEERGLVEAWLAAGVTRLRYLLVRIAAFLLAAAASIALMCAAVLGVARANSEPFEASAIAQQGLALLAVTAFCFAFSLAVAQVAQTRRGAGGVAGMILLALFLVDSATRNGSLEAIRWLSPFWLYDQTQALVRGGSLDVPATAGLAAATALALAVATTAFASRDLDASLLRRAPATGQAVTRPSRDPFLRAPVLATIDQQRGWIVAWAVGIAALAVFLVSLTRSMLDSMLAIPSMRMYMERLGGSGYDTFVATIWGSTAMLLLALFAIFQVSGWVSDDADGRLEAVLAQPVGRTRVALERIASLALAAGIVTLAGALAVWIAARRSDIALSGDRFAAGSALMLLVPLAFGAIGALVAGWRPRAAVPLLTVVAITSYMTLSFAPLFDWPEWVRRTSIFALYGEPIAQPVDWAGTGLLAAICAAAALLALVLFQRRDIAR